MRGALAEKKSHRNVPGKDKPVLCPVFPAFVVKLKENRWVSLGAEQRRYALDLSLTQPQPWRTLIHVLRARRSDGEWVRAGTAAAPAFPFTPEETQVAVSLPTKTF